jgi:hypothetical protein
VKMNSVKEVIHGRRVVDSHLYGSGYIFLRRIQRATKHVDAIRHLQLLAPMSTSVTVDHMVLKLLKPDTKYRIGYCGAQKRTLYAWFLSVAALSEKVRATAASFTASPGLHLFDVVRSNYSHYCA